MIGDSGTGLSDTAGQQDPTVEKSNNNSGASMNAQMIWLANTKRIHIWLLSVFVSAAFSLLIVMTMDFLLNGKITYDYILTGLIASLVVASSVVAFVIYLLDHIARLQQDINQHHIYGKQFISLIDAIPDAIFLKDGEGRWKITNEPARKLFRLQGVDWKDKTDLDLSSMRPEMRNTHAKCNETDQATWNAGTQLSFEEMVDTGADGLRQLEFRKVPIYKKNGLRKGIVVVGRDVTEKLKAERDLRIADTVFKAQEGMLVTDANRTVIRVNPAFTKITGYASEEIIGKTPRLLQSGRHSPEFYAQMWQSINRIGRWEGEIWNKRKNGEIYPQYLAVSSVKDDAGAVLNYVASITDITMSREAAEEIHHLAFYDPLTKLPNRRLFQDRLKVALATSSRSGKQGALLYIDLDNFKNLNDSLGHETGDELLKKVAQRLQEHVREGDTVARLGGDEFVVMLENLSDHAIEAASQAETVARKILSALNAPYLLGTHPYTNTASIGATIFLDHNRTIDKLLQQADIAMYQAKKAGRNSLCLFDPQMQAAINDRLALEESLRHALAENQFVLFYQLQVTDDNLVLGAEVLIRWLKPDQGLVSPAYFIPTAEETGLIIPIGLWVLETTCAQIKAWQQSPLTRDLVLSVNVSPKQFQQPDFISNVQACLERHGTPPRLLKLELTESMLLENSENIIAKMNILNEMGIQFSLDDFGTGYSSLQYLKRLPLNQLKIDKSFVNDIAFDPNDKAIVSTIIAMAKNLGLDVIAEGVETELQREKLMENGCTHFQGYLFSEPLPVDQFEELLTKPEPVHS